MGSAIEFNDVLLIDRTQGFPGELEIDRHQQTAIRLDEIQDRTFHFRKPDIRIYHPAPGRVYLVENLNGKWLWWGTAAVLQQTIHALEKETSGQYSITKLYAPESQRLITIEMSPTGKSYFSFVTSGSTSTVEAQ